jgi:multidrug resistance efflux pump
MKRTSFVVFGWMVLLALGLAGCAGGQGVPAAQAQPAENTPTVLSDRVLAEGRLVPRSSAWLGFRREGIVTEVLVEEGQQVAAGEPLARLGEREPLDAAVKAAELELLSARQALDTLNRTSGVAGGAALQELVAAQRALTDAQEALEDLDTEDYQDDIDDAWVKVVDAESDLEDAQEEFDKYKDLSSDNTNRKNAKTKLDDAQKEYDSLLRDYERLKYDLDQARAELQQAEANLAEAERRYEARKSGPDPDDLALAQSRLANAEAQVASAQTMLANLELRAPFAGTIVRVNIRAGERTAPGQPVVHLADFSQWYVETSDLNELDVVRIDTTQPVTITADALPDLPLSGQVERVYDDYSERAGDVLYTVRVRLNEADARLRWGMTVSANFARK